MNNTTTVIVIPANGRPMYTAKVVDYNDLNRLAGCSTGTTVQAHMPVSEKSPANETSVDLWIDDEGLLANPPKNINEYASNLAGQRLVGDAILIRTNLRTGESVDVGFNVINEELVAVEDVELKQAKRNTSTFQTLKLSKNDINFTITFDNGYSLSSFLPHITMNSTVYKKKIEIAILYDNVGGAQTFVELIDEDTVAYVSPAKFVEVIAVLSKLPPRSDNFDDKIINSLFTSI